MSSGSQSPTLLSSSSPSTRASPCPSTSLPAPATGDTAEEQEEAELFKKSQQEHVNEEEEEQTMSTENLSIRGKQSSESTLSQSQPTSNTSDQSQAATERVTMSKHETPEPTDPHEPLPDFDWQEFEQRFEERMAQADEREAEILQEFNKLTEFFGLWAQTASAHDNDRAFKRIKTREAFVQSAEDSLEAKKQHYTQVVEAFKTALALLSGPRK